MATFIVTDPDTGRKLRLTGDSPPTEQELEAIFAQQPAQPAQQPVVQQPSAQPVDDATNGGVFLPKTDSGQSIDEIAREGRPPGDDILGRAEAVAAVGSGALAEPIAGIAGIAQSLNPFAEPGAGARAVESTRQALTFEPRTQEGRANIAALSKTLAPVAKILEAAEKAGGELGFDLAGPIGGAIGASLPTAALEALGLAGVKVAGKVDRAIPDAQRAAGGAAAAAVEQAPVAAKQAVESVKQASDLVVKTGRKATDLLPARRTAKQVLLEGGLPDSRAAGFLLTPAGQVAPDLIEKAALKQGIDGGLVKTISQANPVDKSKMGEMLDVMETSQNVPLFGVRNRPSDVLGDSLTERFIIVHKANREAGKKLDGVAGDLKGKKIDVSAPVNEFLADLDSAGVKLNPKTGALDFSKSRFRRLPAPQAALNRVVEFMQDAASTGKPVDAFGVHELKVFIDENVTFGKNKEGLGGRAESILKGLRHDLDGVLDSNFDAYDKVNTDYARTRGVIDAFQDAAGTKINLLGKNANKAIGTLSRSVMSNNRSRVNLMNAIDDMDLLAKELTAGGKFPVVLDDVSKLGPKLDDDLMTQVLFAELLDKQFGAAAKTSLQGDAEKAALRAAKSRSITDVAFGVAEAGIDAARGINPENAIQSIRELLKR